MYRPTDNISYFYRYILPGRKHFSPYSRVIRFLLILLLLSFNNISSAQPVCPFTASISANYCIGGGKIRLTANTFPAGSYTYQWSTGGTGSYVDIDIAAAAVLYEDATGRRHGFLAPKGTEH